MLVKLYGGECPGCPMKLSVFHRLWLAMGEGGTSPFNGFPNQVALRVTTKKQIKRLSSFLSQEPYIRGFHDNNTQFTLVIDGSFEDP